MADPRVDALAAVVSRARGAACWLARLASRAAIAGGVTGLALWWFTVGQRVDEWWEGTAGSLVVLLLSMAPALWLLNVRFALAELVKLPEFLAGVASRRTRRLPPGDAPEGGVPASVRLVRGVLRDYGDVVGSWGTVAQLMAPSFWALTLLALAAVPVLVLVAALVVLA